MGGSGIIREGQWIESGPVFSDGYYRTYGPSINESETLFSIVSKIGKFKFKKDLAALMRCFTPPPTTRPPW